MSGRTHAGDTIMTPLSDTQLSILTAACQRADRLVLPLPDRLRGGAAAKVVGSLAAKGLIEEIAAKRGKPLWRETGDKHGMTLVATDGAFAALGIEPVPARTAADARETRTQHARNGNGTQEPRGHQAGEADRDVEAPKGASIEEIGDRIRLAGPHGPGRHRRGAQEEARPERDVREDREAWPGLYGSPSEQRRYGH